MSQPTGADGLNKMEKLPSPCDCSVATSSPEAACRSRSYDLNSLASHRTKVNHCPATTAFCRVYIPSFFRSVVRCPRFEQGTTTGAPLRSSERKSEQVFSLSNLATRYSTPSSSWISASHSVGTFSILFPPPFCFLFICIKNSMNPRESFAHELNKVQYANPWSHWKIVLVNAATFTC